LPKITAAKSVAAKVIDDFELTIIFSEMK